MHNSSTCPICQGLPAEGSMTDEAFFAFLAACRTELADKQSRFQQRVRSGAAWAYDMADCSLSIGRQRFGMTPIGTYSQQYGSWLWAWTNGDFPPLAREAARRLQSLHTITGFRVFLDEGISASLGDAEDFTALAVHALEAIAFFRSISDGTTLYLAVHEPSAQHGEQEASRDGVRKSVFRGQRLPSASASDPGRSCNV